MKQVIHSVSEKYKVPTFKTCIILNFPIFSLIFLWLTKCSFPFLGKDICYQTLSERKFAKRLRVDVIYLLNKNEWRVKVPTLLMLIKNYHYMGLELLDLRIKQLILEFESQNTAKNKSHLLQEFLTNSSSISLHFFSEIQE